MLSCTKIIKKLKEAQLKGEISIKEEYLKQNDRDYIIECGFSVKESLDKQEKKYFIISF